MEKGKKKRTESFASIFGDDYMESPPDMATNVTQVILEELVPFPDHPFKLYQGERFQEMVDSIRNYGVIVPIVVQKKGLKQEILSGHNRVNAAKEAGLTSIPAVIKEGLSEEDAILIVTETNLMQRSFTDLDHSERATVIATRHKAMKSQGLRTDLLKEIERLSSAPNLATKSTSAPLDPKLDSKKNLGDEFNLSRASVTRYLRINKLNPELKQLVDEGKIAMRAGVDLSYLSEENQEMIDAIVSEDTFKVDMKKAALIREYDRDEKLDWKTAKSIVTGEAMKNPYKVKPVKVQPKIIKKFFGANHDNKEIEKIIEKALELYFEREKTADVINQEEGEEIDG